MNEWTDEQTDEQKSPFVPQDFVPFGAAAQKARYEGKEGKIEGKEGKRLEERRQEMRERKARDEGKEGKR